MSRASTLAHPISATLPLAPTLADSIKSGISLRPAHHLSQDRSGPKVGAEHDQAERDQDSHEKYYLELGMERWLPHVRDLSFETTTVPLSVTDAELIRKAYAHLHGRTYYEDSSMPTSSSLSQDLVVSLTELGKRLWPAMRRLGAENDGVFAKLSGRSAKDSPLYTSRLDEALAQGSTNPGVGKNIDNGGNEKLLRLFDASLALMRLRDPASLLWMLINSQRVDEDLDVALRHPERWDQAIVVRRWWKGVTSDLEFRLFVNDGKPTGLTQYNQLIHSERVVARGAAIAEMVCAYYETEVLPRLCSTPFYQVVSGRFTCDIALHPEALPMLDSVVLPKLSTEHIKLVELNCFYEATGMGLFDYHKDGERLSNGPFEWRVREEPMPHAAVKLENEWRDVLRSMNTVTPEAGSMRRLTDAAWAQLDEAQSLDAWNDCV